MNRFVAARPVVRPLAINAITITNLLRAADGSGFGLAFHGEPP